MAIKITYDNKADTMYIRLNNKNQTSHRQEELEKERVIADYDKEGRLIGIEILEVGNNLEIRSLNQKKGKETDKAGDFEMRISFGGN